METATLCEGDQDRRTKNAKEMYIAYVCGGGGETFESCIGEGRQAAPGCRYIFRMYILDRLRLD